LKCAKARFYSPGSETEEEEEEEEEKEEEELGMLLWLLLYFKKEGILNVISQRSQGGQNSE